MLNAIPELEFEASGKVKLPTDEELAEMDADTAILAFTRGVTSDGKPYYVYIAVKPSLYREFYALTSAGKPIAINQYGSVLASGYAAEPPPEVVKDMQKNYGFDEQYEEKLVSEARRQQAEFGKVQEDKRIQDIVTMLKRKQSE